MTTYTKEQAVQFYKERDLEKAYTAFQWVRKRHPKDGMICATLAYLEMEVANSLPKAEQLIEQARTLGCSLAFYHRVRGDILYKKVEIEKAAIEYEQSVKAEPSIGNLTVLAETLTALDNEHALDVWQRVLRHDPKNTNALIHLAREAARNREWHQSLKMLSQVEKLEPSNPEVLFGMGYVYQGLKRYQQAVEYLLKARANGYKDEGYLCAVVAMCYAEIGDNVNAIRLASDAFKLNAENDYVQKVARDLKERAFALVAQGRKPEAYEAIKSALEAWPQDSKLLAYMAGLEMELNRNYEIGQSYMSKAFEYNNADPDLLHEIKGSLWFDYLGDKKEGLACLEKAVSFNRSKFNLKALAYRLIDIELERAERFYEEALQLDPKDSDTICWLADIALKKADWTKGFELAVKAQSLNPDDPYIRATVGRAQLEIGNFHEALDSYAKAVELNHPEKHIIYSQMANCYKKSGDLRKAKECAKKALAIQPDYKEVCELLKELADIK